MKKLRRFPADEAYLMPKNIGWANENFDELEQRVDGLYEVVSCLISNIATISDIMDICKFVLCGYSEGESTYPEVES